ncbi:hypothetical protein A4H97_29505 [Niastella yeongjuensis]|uniref:Uncharacterized protein n=1 Tax=Niastella yeongjuensis TaxID=354355 RepID=A0A1V9ESG4_9BACT|nr:hypothetical protein [Niastella yeongjuensis]OQP49021.1 hypothetical protein A4H97_29505 [Niastella yeongjuensis]SEP10552.1 hypothetical protein SAMN05660816_04397 [Niastella yeongjuensis]
MEKLNCELVKRLDLVEYLAFLGHQAEKVRNGEKSFNSALIKGLFLQKAQPMYPPLRAEISFTLI